jgi:hypothetical protein
LRKKQEKKTSSCLACQQVSNKLSLFIFSE